MINLKVVGLYASDFSGGETRLGDAQIIYDGQNYDVIDGNCGKGATRLISALKSMGIKNPYLHISHPHWDHRDGIRKIIADSYFKPHALYCQNPDSITAHNSEIKSDINALRTVINEARAKDIPVIYLNNGQQIVHGEIKFTVYRDFPKYTGNSDAYLNDGSLCYWFPEIRYLTTGDAGMWCANRYNLHPVFVKGGHHGNDMSGDGLKPSQMCPWLKKHGCLYYWDNDFSTKLTGFLMTGREDAANAGMAILGIHGDIVAAFGAGKATIYHGGKSYSFPVPYNGKGEKVTPTWEKGSKGWWYKYPDGTWATGWKQIVYKGEPCWFLFDDDGWMLTGWRKVDGKWYFLDYKTGVMKTGWHKLPHGANNKEDWYLLNKSGEMLSGWQWSTKDGKTGWYYLDPDNGMRTGWIYDDGEWYCLGDDGRMLTGWVTYKGRKCYLEPLSDKTHVQGVCYRSRTAVIDGKTYYFDKDGYATESSASGAVSIVTPGKKVIDVSEFQPEDIDWTKLKAAGYAVIVRMGLRGSIKGTARYRKVGYDYHFKKYIAGVIAAGIPYSVYYFPTPLSDAEADQEADWIIMNVSGLNLSMPLWLDSEKVRTGVANDISTADRTRYLKRITDKLVAAGIPCGIYASTSWLNNQITMGQLQQQVQENTWCAQYADACTYSGVYAMWQYSNKARVPGIDDEVDISIVKRQFNMSCRKSAPKENAMTKDNVKVFPVTNPVKISNSGSDERGNYKGGAAGDNTGKEWQIRDWYNRPWNCVLRHPDPAVRACLADLATKAANNNRIGYDQYQRQTYWNELQKVNYDPSKITVACEADCSAGVIANIKAAGYILNRPELQNISCTYTGNMRAGLQAAGFACLTDSKYLTSSAYLVAGDVLLNDKHHTATAVTNGIQSDGSMPKAATMLLIKKGSKGSAVLQLQKMLNAKGYKLTEDGDFGNKTEAAVKAYQKANGLEVDGEVGPMTWGVLFK